MEIFYVFELLQLVWRRMSEPNPLTIGDFVYSPDDRISLRRIEQNDEWNLIIKDVQPSDDGVYECAISSRKKYRTHVVLRVIGNYSTCFLILWLYLFQFGLCYQRQIRTSFVTFHICLNFSNNKLTIHKIMILTFYIYFASFVFDLKW